MLAEIKHRFQVKYCLREVNIHAFMCLSGERSTEDLIRARRQNERGRGEGGRGRERERGGKAGREGEM